MGKISNALKIAEGTDPGDILELLKAAPDGEPQQEADLMSSELPLATNHAQPMPPLRVDPFENQRKPALSAHSVAPAAEPAPARAVPRGPASPALAEGAGEGASLAPATMPGVVTKAVHPWVATLLLSRDGGDPRAREQYRLIRTRLVQRGKGSSFVAISSPGIRDGKTLTSINLAVAFALKSEEKVLLLDGDLRAPYVHAMLRVAQSPGLGEVLSGDCDLEDAVFSVEQFPNLYILPAGQVHSSNPADVLDSPAWRKLSARLRESFQRVIVDCPPALGIADFDLLSAEADSVVLVLRQDHTARKACQETLEKVRKKLTGVVLNSAKDWFMWRRHDSDYYYYENHRHRTPKGRETVEPVD
jgi:capsular exopolysaccharide synthesis family protein